MAHRKVRDGRHQHLLVRRGQPWLLDPHPALDRGRRVRLPRGPPPLVQLRPVRRHLQDLRHHLRPERARAGRQGEQRRADRVTRVCLLSRLSTTRIGRMKEGLAIRIYAGRRGGHVRLSVRPARECARSADRLSSLESSCPLFLFRFLQGVQAMLACNHARCTLVHGAMRWCRVGAAAGERGPGPSAGCPMCVG